MHGDDGLAEEMVNQSNNQSASSNIQGSNANVYRGILDIENHNQQTPFFVAVVKGFLDIAELLTID
jgi:hypothetical protein